MMDKVVYIDSYREEVILKRLRDRVKEALTEKGASPEDLEQVLAEVDGVYREFFLHFSINVAIDQSDEQLARYFGQQFMRQVHDQDNKWKMIGMIILLKAELKILKAKLGYDQKPAPPVLRSV